MAMGKYLYCIIRGGDERTFDGVAAIGDSALPVYTVPYGALAAVVSDSPFERYEATRANLVSHERVIEAVMREQTPLPVRFGTIADPADAVADIQKLLDTRATEFDGLLREMDGRVEMGLKAFWRSDAIVFDQIVAEDAQIRALRDSLKRSPSGASQASRIRLGEMVKAALGRRRDAEAAKILAPLRSIAERFREIKQRQPENATACVLATIPGCAAYGSLALAARIGSIKRFPRPASLANYWGLTPGCRNSGEATDRLGSITKQGSAMATEAKKRGWDWKDTYAVINTYNELDTGKKRSQRQAGPSTQSGCNNTPFL